MGGTPVQVYQGRMEGAMQGAMQGDMKQLAVRCRFAHHSFAIRSRSVLRRSCFVRCPGPAGTGGQNSPLARAAVVFTDR